MGLDFLKLFPSEISYNLINPLIRVTAGCSSGMNQT